MPLLLRPILVKFVYEKDATQPVEIASITKLTYRLPSLIEALENGSITLSTPVDISDYPYQLTTNSEASQCSYGGTRNLYCGRVT